MSLCEENGFEWLKSGVNNFIFPIQSLDATVILASWFKIGKEDKTWTEFLTEEYPNTIEQHVLDIYAGKHCLKLQQVSNLNWC